MYPIGAMSFGMAGWVERKAGNWDFWHRWWLVLEAEATPSALGRLTWFTVQDTASLSATHYQWSCARSLRLENITGLRLCCTAEDDWSTCGTEIELLTPSTSCGAHRFRFASVEERLHWVDKLTELIFSRECRALGSTDGVTLPTCPHCTSAKCAPGDATWCPNVGGECLWQPVSSKKSSHHQQVQEPVLAKVVYRGWPDFAKPCKERGHRQQWLGLVLTHPISKGGDGTVKGVQYYTAPAGCGRMIATANARCTPVPLGWVPPEISPEPEPEAGVKLAHAPKLEATMDAEQAAKSRRPDRSAAPRGARTKGRRPAEGTPPNPSRSTGRRKKTIEGQVTGHATDGDGGRASRLDRLAAPKSVAQKSRAPDRDVHAGRGGARASVRTGGEARARRQTRPQRGGARGRGRARAHGVDPGQQGRTD